MPKKRKRLCLSTGCQHKMLQLTKLNLFSLEILNIAWLTLTRSFIWVVFYYKSDRKRPTLQNIKVGIWMPISLVFQLLKEVRFENVWYLNGHLKSGVRVFVYFDQYLCTARTQNLVKIIFYCLDTLYGRHNKLDIAPNWTILIVLSIWCRLLN